MTSIEFKKEFNLTAKQAYDTILLWLATIKARITDYKEPFNITAVHGSYWKFDRDPAKKKKIRITIRPKEPSNPGVKIHLKASLSLWRPKQRIAQVQQSWDDLLFSQLWVVLNETKQEEILWHIKVTQFLVALQPPVKNKTDFKRFMKKLCQRLKVEQLTNDQVLQITEALKLQLLTAKIFAPSKKERVFRFVESLSKSVFGETLTDSISGALRGLVEYSTK